MHGTSFVVTDRRKAVSEVYLVGNVELMLAWVIKNVMEFPTVSETGWNSLVVW